MTQLNDQTVHEIFEDLRLNVKLSQDLLTLLTCETEALKAMKAQELLRISKEKSTLLSKIQYIDEALKNHMTDNTPAAPPQPGHGYAAAAGPAQFKITGLIQLLPPDRQEAATQCKEKLSKIRQDILVKNYINKKFTEDTLGYLGDAINLFTQPVARKGIYDASGLAPKKASSLPQLLSKEV